MNLSTERSHTFRTKNVNIEKWQNMWNVTYKRPLNEYIGLNSRVALQYLLCNYELELFPVIFSANKYFRLLVNTAFAHVCNSSFNDVFDV
jgi:hypothetical protein